jgi:uncharacterized protein
MGPKSYEQCAGFLKIPESPEPLDNTWVHPENYGVAREIRAMLGGSLSSATIAELKEKHGVGDATISDIVEELKKPNRDPRESYPKPVMQKGVVNFEDLKEGMTVTGKIKNVVDFGAFVDLGIKETALVHVSELSDRFVKDPLDVVKVGDVLEFKILNLDIDRRRIALSRKTNPGSSAAPAGGAGGSAARSNTAARHGEKKRVVAVKSGQGKPAPHPAEGSAGAATGQRGERPDAGGSTGGAAGRPGTSRPAAGGNSPRPPARPPADDDGTMYNPFAAALEKAAQRKEKGRKK